jgi:hypothetical protein
MSIAQPSVVTTPLPCLTPPTVGVALLSDATDADFERRWSAWQRRGRARRAVTRGRVQSVGLFGVIAAAVAGILRLSFGWFQ